jgi:hypothetical protein
MKLATLGKIFSDKAMKHLMPAKNLSDDKISI